MHLTIDPVFRCSSTSSASLLFLILLQPMENGNDFPGSPPPDRWIRSIGACSNALQSVKGQGLVAYGTVGPLSLLPHNTPFFTDRLLPKMPQARVLYWFRTDLRLHDSPALKAALDLKPEVLYPIWCWDSQSMQRREPVATRSTSADNLQATMSTAPASVTIVGNSSLTA